MHLQRAVYLNGIYICRHLASLKVGFYPVFLVILNVECHSRPWREFIEFSSDSAIPGILTFLIHLPLTAKILKRKLSIKFNCNYLYQISVFRDYVFTSFDKITKRLQKHERFFNQNSSRVSPKIDKNLFFVVNYEEKTFFANTHKDLRRNT